VTPETRKQVKRAFLCNSSLMSVRPPLFSKPQDSPACPSDNRNIMMKISIEYWWNGTDRGKQNIEYWWNGTDRGKQNIEYWWNGTERGKQNMEYW
jgi:hypothetical protein